jgi:ATP-dependent DNA ligase
MEKVSRFLKTGHPEKEIRADVQTFRRILEEGWWGQAKIHGHRAQIHISAAVEDSCLVFNRHGRLHAKLLDPEIVAELRRILSPQSDWSTIEAEWLKSERKLFLFDYIKKDGKVLSSLNYEERYQLLPRLYLSPFVSTLAILRTAEECMEIMKDPSPHIEGLMFKSRHSKGFSDFSMIRCRKPEARL